MELIPKKKLFPLEEIRPVVGYEGLYCVTNYSRIWSLKTKKFLKPSLNRERGYLKVNLWINNKCHTTKIYRVSCKAFLPNPYNLPEINHKDGNKLNNFLGLSKNNYKYGNLEWCTRNHNICHAIRNGLIKKT